MAKVLEAGATESGRPFFVMEFVCGIPITDDCDKARPRRRMRATTIGCSSWKRSRALPGRAALNRLRFGSCLLLC
jgi:hypothetical protein